MLLLAASAGIMTTSTMADTFGRGANAFTIDFVTIGNPGNEADTTGYGAVPYTYQMGKYEVSRDMITKANKVGRLGITLTDMTDYGGNGPNQPAIGPTWYEAARFVNYLNTSTGHAAAYNFDENGNFALWPAGEAWQQGGENLYRNKDAHYFLPSENEWYKAAYHNGTGYFAYPTGSDTESTPVAGGTAAGTAVYDEFVESAPASIYNAGGLSPYGTMAQGGNAWEWMEGAVDGLNDSPSEGRVLRGGVYGLPGYFLSSSVRSWTDPSNDGSIWWGYRVAAVLEEADATVIIDGCNTGVPNLLLPGGSTIADEIAHCAAGAGNHGNFVSCVAHFTGNLKQQGLITNNQAAAINTCAAKAEIP